MSESKGIEQNCIKYNWGKLPNGNYVIANVPVFQVFNDVEHGNVDQAKAREILKNFELDKQKGYFPRVFIGHHPDNSPENRPGAGFLNNLSFDGKFFFADIVEIPEDVFKDFQALKYPNRSVEYNDEKQKITGMALLESQPPFFQFPILFLEKTERLDKFQAKKYSVIGIQNSVNAKGINKMPDEIKKDEKVDMVEDKGEGLNFCQQKYQELSDGVGAQMKALNEKFDKVIDILSRLISMEGEEAEMQGREKMQDEEVQEVPEKIEEPADEEIPGKEDEDDEKIGKKPGSVAYQLREIRKDLSRIKRQGYEAHRMSKPTASMIDKGSFLHKYQANSLSIQKIARDASEAWSETSNHPNKQVAGKFQAMWPSQEKFVDHIVKMEEIDPGYFKRMTM